MNFLFYLAIFLLGFGAAFITAISGGLGLIIRPILLFLGIPAPVVIATSRVTIIGDIPRLFILHKHKQIDWGVALFLVIPYAIGSILSVFIVVLLPLKILEFCLGILLLIMAIFYLVNKNIGLVEKKSPFTLGISKIISFLGTLFISIIGTVVGGLGPIYTSLYIWAYGKSYIKAASVSHVSSFLGGLVGAIFFILSGLVDWYIAISLIFGLVFGFYFGTTYGLKKGENYVRYLIVIVAIIAGIKLIFF
ncbi:MAG: sulfite exporter TauE/SafE family protein [archaeon]